MAAPGNGRGGGKPSLPLVTFVTGKGGTGKSTVAAALTLALARRGPATLIDLDRRRSAIKAVSAVPESGGYPITTVALTARGELESFIERIVPLKALARRMLQSRTFGFVASALPGLEAFLMIERVRLLANAAGPGRAIVVDGPATGGALELLAVPAGVQRLAPAGTLHRLAKEVETFLQTAQRFGVLLVTRAEQLGLHEAIDAKAALAALGIGCAGAVLDACDDALFTADDLSALSALDSHRRIAQARRESAEATLQARRELGRAGLDPLKLPMLYSAVVGAVELTALANLIDPGRFAR